MPQITIALGDEAIKQLARAAEALGVTVEEMASTVIDDYARKEQIREVVQRELTKNAELYRRLARGPGSD